MGGEDGRTRESDDGCGTEMAARVEAMTPRGGGVEGSAGILGARANAGGEEDVGTGGGGEKRSRLEYRRRLAELGGGVRQRRGQGAVRRRQVARRSLQVESPGAVAAGRGDRGSWMRRSGKC